MPVRDERERYVSYLLRLWQTTSGDQVVWRASLENSQTGERHGFASLDVLLDFLRQTADTKTEPRGMTRSERCPSYSNPQPSVICSSENRFVRSAMWIGLAGDDGACTPKLIEAMVGLAEGGWA